MSADWVFTEIPGNLLLFFRNEELLPLGYPQCMHPLQIPSDAHQCPGPVIYSCRGGWSASKNAVNTFLLCSPAAQESPAQTSLFGRSPVCESSLDFRSGLAPAGSTPASLPARLSSQTTRPFNHSFTCLDDVVLRSSGTNGSAMALLGDRSSG